CHPEASREVARVLVGVVLVACAWWGADYVEVFGGGPVAGGFRCSSCGFLARCRRRGPAGTCRWVDRSSCRLVPGAVAGADVHAFTLGPEQDEQFGGFW